MNPFAALEKEIRAIQSGKSHPVYLLWGEEFLVSKALAALLDALIPKEDRALNLEVFDSGAPGWERAPLALGMPGLFPSRKVVVVRGALAQPVQGKTPGGAEEPKPKVDETEKALFEILEKGLAGSHILVLTSEKPSAKNPVYKKAMAAARVFPFDPVRERSGQIRGAALEEILSQALRNAGKKIEPRARAIVLRRGGKALRPFATELEKLLLYVGKQDTITAKDVENSFADLGEAWIFDWTKMIGDGSAEGSLKLLHDLLNQGEHPLRLLSTLSTEVRNLLRARAFLDSEHRHLWKPGMNFQQFQSRISEATPECQRFFGRAHPYSAFLSLERAAGHSLDKFKRDLMLIHKTDLTLKRSVSNPRMVMETLLLELCGLGHNRPNPPFSPNP